MRGAQVTLIIIQPVAAGLPAYRVHVTLYSIVTHGLGEAVTFVMTSLAEVVTSSAEGVTSLAELFL